MVSGTDASLMNEDLEAGGGCRWTAMMRKVVSPSDVEENPPFGVK